MKNALDVAMVIGFSFKMLFDTSDVSSALPGVHFPPSRTNPKSGSDSVSYNVSLNQ